MTPTGVMAIKENSSRIFFEPDGHKYYVNTNGGQRELLSVTTIIGDNNLSEFANISKETLAFPCYRGSTGHKITEYVDAGIYSKKNADEHTKLVKENFDIDYNFDGIAVGYKKFLRENNPVWEMNETALFSPKWLYCGRPDRAGIIDGVRYLIDIKTGATAPTACLQLEAYARIINEIVPPKDRIQKRAVLFLNDKGEYKFEECESTYNGYPVSSVWLSALTLSQIRKNKK